MDFIHLRPTAIELAKLAIHLAKPARDLQLRTVCLVQVQLTLITNGTLESVCQHALERIQEISHINPDNCVCTVPNKILLLRKMPAVLATKTVNNLVWAISA